MPLRSKATTIQDVATLAGVSPATVSKVLNHAPHVRGSTRERVLEAVQKLNFRPNRIARSLKAKRTLTIGVVSDDPEGLFTIPMLRGVEDAVSPHGFSVFMSTSHGDMARERALLEVFLDKQVDGLILMSGYRVRARGAPALPLNDVPVVYLYQYTSDVAVPCVIPDDKGGAQLGVRHLIEAGRRRIGMISGTRDYEATIQRLDGYREALHAAGIAFNPLLVCEGDWHEASAYALAHELMAMPEPPDALFCGTDSMAVGALDALHERKLRVPEDVAVLGFDNRIFAPYQRPPLTTVALPFYEMGQRAGQLLLAAIRGDAPTPAIHREPCYLVERQSSRVSA